jgi:hypothetical protein
MDWEEPDTAMVPNLLAEARAKLHKIASEPPKE